MKTKKILSLLLVFAMLFSMFSMTVSADSTQAYVPDYDTETPVIIVHGMSQNNTYLVDEDGNWVPDETDRKSVV